MLIRVTGGSHGIAEYLVNGQKQDRELTRDELDERVILDGDLEFTDAIIKGMEKEGERYLHITIAFKEDALDPEILKGITSDFKQFAMSAYDADEFNFYAEAHLPKVKSYANRQTGELIERKPHIHIVIPEQNLLSGQNLNPFGKVEQQVKFLEAFQEHANAKYGLASPKDNRRLAFTSESEIISRYKGDLFQGSAKDVKERILSDVLDRNISDYASFKSLLAEHGARRTRNAGKDSEYQNVKPADQAKGINLKDYVFSREFIEKPEAEKRQFLANEGRRKYESQQPAKPLAPELAARLQEWHEIRAPELKYINSGNRNLYAAYRAANHDEKRAILADRAERFYTKHQASRALGAGTLKTFNDKESRNARPEYDRITPDRARPGQRAAALYQSDIAKTGRAAAPRPLSSVRNLSGVGMVQHERPAQMLLQPNAPDRVGRERTADSEMRRARTGDSRAQGGQERGAGKRSTDSVTGQLLADQQERATQAKAANLAEFAQIKRELDARRLLAHLSKTHGVIPDKYQVTKAKDGGDRINAGSRNLNVSDFLTQEMRLNFNEAAPILRQVYAAQQGREVIEAKTEPRRELWEAFRKAQPDQAKQKAREWDAQRQSEKARRATIRDDYQAERRAIQNDRCKPAAERKAALSIARMERVTRDMALREAVREERQQLREKHRQPYQERYRAFLAERANKGDENALAELRRQRDTSPAPTGPNAIESAGHKRDRDEKDTAAHLARSLAYDIDRAGNVTYYADQTRSRALVIDSGQRVTVAAAKDTQAVETGLRLAVQKFGPDLKIEGSDEFKRQVIDAALKTGLRVEFDSKAMNEELARRRAERDELQARGKAFIAGERERAEQAKAPKQPAPERTPEPEHTTQPEPEQPRRSRGHDYER
ncbi:LPD7 domain-containing protein [Rivihabitans pingtungensis]|uniref:Large polyvalent protein-associated domain-containing protein n=1 Tax=Rivihabitans pingtungensis TaxID=1054498 RepID=A0A318KI07_9NEIS|nr:LPD7 domain-containing protein [Rivihabitans pingtungensis]PXX73675.1 hypothetical protein DFR34_1395 [Rivihabitans pingtungensis]